MADTAVALNRFIERVRQLYSLPAVALEVLDLTATPQVDMRALKDCIENDPALTTKVLRVVNSSLFGLSSEVSDLNQALALLGIKPLKLLVLGFSLSDSLFLHSTGEQVDHYWRHTLTQAVAAREISQRVWRLAGDEAFIASLLADIGMLVLLQELGQPYARFLARAQETRSDVGALEARALGFNHQMLGSRLLHDWKLPAAIVSAIDLSFYPERLSHLPASEQTPARILRVARLLADLLVDQRLDLLPEILRELALDGPLDAESVTQLTNDLQQKVDQLAGVFSFELPAGLDYRDVLVEAHSRMSQLTTEMAGGWLRTSTLHASAMELAVLAEAEQLAAAMAAFSGQGSAELAALGQTTESAAEITSGLTHLVRKNHLDASNFGVPSDQITELDLAADVATAVSASRRTRSPLSLALVEIDRFSELAGRFGPLEAEQIVRKVGRICGHLDYDVATCRQFSQAGFALLWPNYDRRQAVELGETLLAEVRLLASRTLLGDECRLGVSVGLATVTLPSKNFLAGDLLQSAGRCLSAAQLSGGNTLKSIGVY